jgi:ribosomal protein S18 acetylase RimI-like enzyme
MPGSRLAPLFADLTLARRVERTDAHVGVESALIHARLHPEEGAAAEELAGGVAVFTGVGSTLTQALGLGMSGPVAERELDRVEEFFTARGAGTTIEFCPLADESLLHLLGEHGYRLRGCSNLLCRSLSGAEPLLPQTSGMEVQQCFPGEADLWASVVAAGFSEALAARKEEIKLFASLVQAPETVPLLAWVDGEPAGGGALAMHEKVAALYGTSTLPKFRRRGVQSSLLRALISQAIQQECDLAYSLTRPGTVSQRNLERQGFRVAYTRFTMVREL